MGWSQGEQMGEILGTIAAAVILTVVYFILRGLPASVPLMPKPRPCPKCGEQGWSDFLVINHRDPKLERELSTPKAILGGWVAMGSMIAICMGLLFLTYDPVRSVPAVVLGLFGIVWAYRFKSAQPVHSCGACGYRAPSNAG
jgi:hypothetical protein